MKSFDRLIFFVIAGLGLLLALVILLGNRAGLPAPQILLVDGKVGARGPLTLIFSEAVSLEDVEPYVHLQPPVAGRFTLLPQREDQPGYALAFWPDRPLQAGQVYSLMLAAGVRSQSSLELRQSQTWQFEVRQPEILYLAPTDSPELWQSAGDGSAPRQLTYTEGRLFDFDVFPDGSRVIYSALNQQKGIDLWVLDRWSGETRLLLPCESDWCSNPAVSPDGSKIAYSRRRAGSLPGEGPGVPRVWLLDLQQQLTDVLYADPNIGGFEPAWSPNGRYLAFFDGLSHGVRVLELATGSDFLLPSDMGMVAEWSPDSQRLFFSDYSPGEVSPSVAVYEVDVASQQIRRMWDEEMNSIDYSVPAWSADGEVLAVAIGRFLDGPGKQLWLASKDGQPQQAITDDPQFTNASYHWDPAGQQRLVFQRLELGQGSTLPEVMLWDRQSGVPVLVAENAFLPLWMP